MTEPRALNLLLCICEIVTFRLELLSNQILMNETRFLVSQSILFFAQCAI
jgi:hypothetical protein